MPKGEYLGELEQTLLWAVVRFRGEAYGMTVRREVEERGGRRVAIGAVYATLDRLEAKGYVTSRDGDPTPQRGGRARRYFTITAAGVDALNASRDILTRMSKGLRLGTVAAEAAS